MLIHIDFNSEEAIYQQLCNQIILGIATCQFEEGQVLPSVRQLADDIGINMHTVNKAYTVLKQEGFDKQRAEKAIGKDLRVLLAEAICRNLTREDIHGMVDRIYDEYERYINS